MNDWSIESYEILFSEGKSACMNYCHASKLCNAQVPTSVFFPLLKKAIIRIVNKLYLTYVLYFKGIDKNVISR